MPSAEGRTYQSSEAEEENREECLAPREARADDYGHWEDLKRELQEEMVQRLETLLEQRRRGERMGRAGRRRREPANWRGDYGLNGAGGEGLGSETGVTDSRRARSRIRREVLSGLRAAEADWRRRRRNPYARIGDAIVDDLLEQAQDYGLSPSQLAQVMEGEMGSWWGRLRSFLSSPQGRYFLAGALGTAFLFTAGPSLGKTLRPVLRQGVHGLIALSDQVQGFIARTQEGLKDIVAEAQYQYQQGRAQAAALSPAPPAPDQAVTTGAVTAGAGAGAGLGGEPKTNTIRSASVDGAARDGLAQADGASPGGNSPSDDDLKDFNPGFPIWAQSPQPDSRTQSRIEAGDLGE
ncbi:MAG: hypothetical protein H5U02_05350 [Clostridia bacterium]|nr:hypothetical protein [Clostridia bacterium]